METFVWRFNTIIISKTVLHLLPSSDLWPGRSIHLVCSPAEGHAATIFATMSAQRKVGNIKLSRLQSLTLQACWTPDLGQLCAQQLLAAANPWEAWPRPNKLVGKDLFESCPINYALRQQCRVDGSQSIYDSGLLTRLHIPITLMLF